MVAMASNIDIYRSAKLLIDQHGEDAGLEATRSGARCGTDVKRPACDVASEN